MINKAILVGRLGSDPEVRYSASGTAVVKFSLATDSFYNKEKRTEWHRIVAFGKIGEVCGEYLSKGRQVYIEGRIQTSSWEKDGVKRYSTEIIANEVKFLGDKGSGGGGGGRSYQSGGGGGNAPGGPPADGPSYSDGPDDDLPF